MGSYGLPALHINPPQQQESPISQIGQILALKNQVANAPLQRQALEQEVQSRTLENQKSQTALKDQQIMSGVMQKWGQPATAGAATQSTAPDYDSLLDLARKSGVSYSTYQGIQQHVLDMKQKAATIAKDDAQTKQDQAGTIIKNNGMIVDALTGIINAPDQELVPRLTSTVQQLQQQGLLDPQHIQMAQQLAQSGNPAAIRQQLDVYAKSLGGYSKIQEQASNELKLQQEKGKSDPNSPFYAPSATSVAMGTAPGAAQIQAGEVKQAAAKAGAEAKARMPYEVALNQQRQALSQGDPRAAAQLLVDGDATLSELKSRGATPEFIAKTLYNAKQLSKGQYNAQAADAQFKVAQSPQQVQFFGSAKSLTDKGGTLDQLMETAKKIPQNQLPVFNSIEDWTRAAAGSGPLAQYAAQVLGVADDYAKVMGGGVGSDASRLSAANLIAAKLSKEGREGAVTGIRGSVNSQTRSRIGDNAVLMRMYGSQLPKEEAAPSSGGLSVTAPNGKVYSFKSQADADAFKQKAGIQ